MHDCQHLLIDGYNLIHQWPKLRLALRHGSDAARNRLAEVVRVIHDFDGVRTTIVFDGRGQEVGIERPGGHLTFSFLFSPASMSADELIEQYINKASKPETVCVVTGDNMVRETAGALGAHTITPEDLENWVLSCERRQSEELTKRRRQTQKDWRGIE